MPLGSSKCQTGISELAYQSQSGFAEIWKGLGHTSSDRQCCIISSQYIVALLLFHVCALKVRLIEDESVRASSTFKGIRHDPIFTGDVCGSYGEAVGAVGADLIALLVEIFDRSRLLTSWRHLFTSSDQIPVKRQRSRKMVLCS